METKTQVAPIGHMLKTNKVAQVAEIVLVFAVAGTVMVMGFPYANENPVALQIVVWIANVLMLGMVWLGLHLRGQTWAHFGLSFRFPGWARIGKALLKSVVVFVAAVAAFVLGSIVMAPLTGIPESADMSDYSYLQGNLPMLLLALTGAYTVSAFGEEIIYRGFLINRLTEMGSSGLWGVRSAVLISAIIFGLVHYTWGPMGIVQTTFMGLVLGIAYLVLKRRLWVLILAHAYMDTILLVQMYAATE